MVLYFILFYFILFLFLYFILFAQKRTTVGVDLAVVLLVGLPTAQDMVLVITRAMVPVLVQEAGPQLVVVPAATPSHR